MGPVVQMPIDLTLGEPKIQRKLPNKPVYEFRNIS